MRKSSFADACAHQQQAIDQQLKERQAMTIPAVMFLEMAMDVLKAQDPLVIEHEMKEFRMLGSGRLDQIRASLAGRSDFECGYLIGLETARALLSGMPAAAQAGVSL